MEQSLLKLLKEFNTGELRGFDSAYSLEQMESVRDQQEALGNLFNITGALCVENKIKQHWLFFFGKGRLNLLEGGTK